MDGEIIHQERAGLHKRKKFLLYWSEKCPKKLITPERNALSDATIEASECLKAW
jgi:hypothetical protein